MSTYLVTGASRGIGLELTKQLSQLDQSRVSKVLALTRGQPSKELSQIAAVAPGKVVNIPCDVTVQKSISEALETAQSELGSGGLDVLVNNAGVCTGGHFCYSIPMLSIASMQIQKLTPGGARAMEEEDLIDEFKVNVLSAHMMIKAFLPLLEKGRDRVTVNMYATLYTMERWTSSLRT